MDGIINEPDFDQSRYADEGTLAYIAKLEQQLAVSLAENLRLRELVPKRIPNGFVSFGKWYAEQEDIFADPHNRMSLFKKKYLIACEEALSAPPGDQSALREVIAQVLAEVEHRRWATKLAIDQLRSGEWTPDAIK